LRELQDRKRLLTVQADLHRAVLSAQCENLAGRVGWIASLVGKGQSAAPWLAGGAALAGWLVARNRTKAAGWISTAFAAWRWFRKVKADGQHK
jgi:hypothetical protein